MDRKPSTARLLILAGLLSAVLLTYLGVLVDTQVVHHADYLAQSIHSIAREERVEASRGIITDRSGRTLVSNSSAYDLTFDASLLDDGEEQNLAILRLVELCQKEGKAWVDNLPISETAPFIYALDGISDTQRSRFFTYLKSLNEVAGPLGEYLLLHPELVPEEEPEPDTAPSAEEDGADVVLTPTEQAKELLKRLPASSLTEQLLLDAGITAPDLVLLMGEKMDLPDGLTLLETRKILGVRYELALRRLANYTDYILVENIDTAFISKISDGNYAGARITTSSVRQYETEYAAHILGYVSRLEATDDLKALREQGYDGNDWIGRSGVESAFEKYLKGTDGKRVVSVNSDGKITGEYYSKEPKPGNTVELTIDLELQKAVEEALASTVTRLNEDPKYQKDADTRGAGAAVIKVGTGEVLSLASYPTYDLSSWRQNWNELSADLAKPMFNRATQGTYAPGSTLKPLTAVAALEEGATTLTEKIRDTGRWAYPNDPTGSGAWCWNRSGHGNVDVSQAITVSCNYFFAEMGYRLGMDTFREYLTAFGLGENTGIETGDDPGALPENKAGENQTPWAAFGQSNQLYSPIQLANYIATMVSGGAHYDAHLLKAVKTYDNSEVVTTGNTAPTNVIQMNESTLAAVKKGMHDLTTSSLAPYFSQCVVEAGAKTGTAQVGAETENTGVFVCFAPYDEPEIAVSIVIEKGGSGSALATAAVEILNAYFSADEIGTAVLPENQLIP